MPSFNWTNDPSQIIVDFEKRYRAPEASALLSWAVSSVEALHYLADLDQTYNDTRLLPAGHKPDVVDVAHARWATSTSITALDLCAAAFGRAFCNNSGPQELDLGNLDPSRRSTKHRRQLPLRALNWVDGVFASQDFVRIKIARDSLIHRRLSRHLYMSTAPDRRLELQIGSVRCSAGCLVVQSRNLATAHVSDLLNRLPQF